LEQQAPQPSGLNRDDPLALFLAEQRSAATGRAYTADLRHFFGGDPSTPQVTEFLGLPTAQLTQRLQAYKTDLVTSGASEATVNRRLSVIRSLLRFAYRHGLASSDGRGLVAGEKVPPSRDRKVVTASTLRRLVAAPGAGSVRGLRDTAILLLLCENALRRSELCALNVSDFSMADRSLQILDKGQGSRKETVPLSRKTAEAVATYVGSAGHAALSGTPLFRNLDHRPGVAGGRLTADGVYFLVREYGHEIGDESLTPHQLRRSAIAAALENIGERVRRVLRIPSDPEGLYEVARQLECSAQMARSSSRTRGSNHGSYFVMRDSRGKLHRVLRVARVAPTP